VFSLPELWPHPAEADDAISPEGPASACWIGPGRIEILGDGIRFSVAMSLRANRVSRECRPVRQQVGAMATKPSFASCSSSAG